MLAPTHDVGWADIDERQAGLVMAALRDRFEEHGRRVNVRYTQAIVNHGREAGASLVHPHGQLLGLPFVPGELAEELAGFVRFGEACLLCTTAEAELASGHRVVYADDRVVVAAPFWSGVAFELLVMPLDHSAHLARAEPRDLAAVGHALRDVLGKLRRAVGDVAYNVVFHTAPHHQRDDHYHWHVHVLPRLTSVAGFEQGTGRAHQHRGARGRGPAAGRDRLTLRRHAAHAGSSSTASWYRCSTTSTARQAELGAVDDVVVHGERAAAAVEAVEAAVVVADDDGVAVVEAEVAGDAGHGRHHADGV